MEQHIAACNGMLAASGTKAGAMRFSEEYLLPGLLQQERRS